jgi:hypothetical protein
VATDRSRPDEDTIRRALAECMTVSDIDDAMGWSSGTARRRRWRAPDRGGLPNADAELGGIALWFRSTIEAWQAAPVTGRARRAIRESSEPDPTLVPDEPGAADEPAPGVGPDDDGGAAEPAATDSSAGDEPPAEPESGAEATTEEPPEADPEGATAAATPPAGEPAVVTSGFDLAVGQNVVVDVRGAWREAVVAHRDRTTVVVDYRIDDSPFGTRRQRIGTDRVRLPIDEE